MTILVISHMDTHTDKLSRIVTTLTQEVFVKVNQAEEDIFVDVLKQVDEQSGCEDISYNNYNWSDIEVSGYAVNKAIETINNIAGHTLIAPVTEINDKDMYEVRFIY